MKCKWKMNVKASVHLKKCFPRIFSDTLTLFNPNLSSLEKRVQWKHFLLLSIKYQSVRGESDLLNDFIRIHNFLLFFYARNIIDIHSRTCDSQMRRDLIGFEFDYCFNRRRKVCEKDLETKALRVKRKAHKRTIKFWNIHELWKENVWSLKSRRFYKFARSLLFPWRQKSETNEAK